MKDYVASSPLFCFVGGRLFERVAIVLIILKGNFYVVNTRAKSTTI